MEELLFFFLGSPPLPLKMIGESRNKCEKWTIFEVIYCINGLSAPPPPRLSLSNPTNIGDVRGKG